MNGRWRTDARRHSLGRSPGARARPCGARAPKRGVAAIAAKVVALTGAAMLAGCALPRPAGTSEPAPADGAAPAVARSGAPATAPTQVTAPPCAGRDPGRDRGFARMVAGSRAVVAAQLDAPSLAAAASLAAATRDGEGHPLPVAHHVALESLWVEALALRGSLAALGLPPALALRATASDGTGVWWVAARCDLETLDRHAHARLGLRVRPIPGALALAAADPGAPRPLAHDVYLLPGDWIAFTRPDGARLLPLAAAPTADPLAAAAGDAPAQVADLLTLASAPVRAWLDGRGLWASPSVTGTDPTSDRPAGWWLRATADAAELVPWAADDATARDAAARPTAAAP